MKIKKNILKILAVATVMLLILAPLTQKTDVKANNLYQESLYFDEDGNFFMTTHDIKATKSTRYCTLGWTIKRYNLPIDDPENMCATIVITCDGSVEDPENEKYLYSYFYCDKDTIFNAIGNVSEEWQRELYLNGATVYLDGIMTVIENDATLGSLSSDGSRSGEVYDTYEGIVSARNWGPNSKNSLRTHFNKSMYFPAVEDFFKEEGPTEDAESGSIQESFGRWGPELDAGISVSASRYNPAVAIPSGESIQIQGWQQSYAYNVEYKKVSGEIACAIPIILIATQTSTDESGQLVETEVPITERVYEFMMPYTYYMLGSVELYYADGIYVTSDAFGGGVYIDMHYQPDIKTVTREMAEHVVCEPVSETVLVNIGMLTDAEEIEACVKAALAGVANKPQVRNDYLSINGDVIMTDEWTEQASVPGRRTSAPNVSNSTSITIPVNTPNAEYTIKANAYYDYMTFGSANGGYINKVIDDAGEITVHTPVVCYGSISDVKEWNQAEIPSKENSTIVLGKEFNVAFSNRGEHISAKGYGEKDYAEYVLYNQVMFPFDVLDAEGTFVSAGSWIALEAERNFIVPTTVVEGEYNVEFRAVASNFDERFADDQGIGENANLSPDEQIAADSVTVNVVGQLYGFELTQLVEYKSVIDLENSEEEYNVAKLPLLWNDDGLPLGSYFRFRLESVGSYAKGATVTITPSFWYITEETPIEVDIYYEAVTADRRIVLRKWNTDAHRLELTEDDCILPKEAKNNGKAIESVTESGDRHQLWSGIYMLPMKSYCLPKADNLPGYGIDKNSFLEDGHILVKFDIKIEDERGENVLLYINNENAKEGYCNRWQKEGGKDGEVIVYNTGKSVKDSMKITGTH